MFDFEKLDVYQVIRGNNSRVLKFIYSHPTLDLYLKDQWKSASMSILLNLAEGTGRMNNTDKKHYLTIARGSVFESVAILEAVHDLGFIEETNFKEFYDSYEQISKMLLGMIRSYST
ncbi:MAG TPA: four helix bundle protein [Bacteroidales bacterium]|nr:four helix bundle protein [Bacteroidales bacterium]